MKKFAAILFSLLLIAAQTLAVAFPVSSSAQVAKPSCCGEDCQCCVSQSDSPAPPVPAAPAPSPAQNHFALPPAAIVLFTVGSAAVEASPSSGSAEFSAAATPLFQRNCVFMI